MNLIYYIHMLTVVHILCPVIKFESEDVKYMSVARLSTSGGEE